MRSKAPLYAFFSIGASLLTLGLKLWAWRITGSVGLLSDGLEALVNLSAGVMALIALSIAVRPADRAHAFGHGKAEYFAGTIEGLLILVAAGGIIFASLDRFMHPAPLSSLGPGLVVAMLAALVNLVTARILLNAARRFDSITLEADARHLLTDVWTSVGMVLGLSVLLVTPPSWHVLDPLIAMAMALHIVRTGFSLIRRSASGLMDRALPDGEVKRLEQAISGAMKGFGRYARLRTRKSGATRFVEMVLILPGETTVEVSHKLCCDIEEAIKMIFPLSQTTIHVEPEGDHNDPQGCNVR